MEQGNEWSYTRIRGPKIHSEKERFLGCRSITSSRLPARYGRSLSLLTPRHEKGDNKKNEGLVRMGKNATFCVFFRLGEMNLGKGRIWGGEKNATYLSPIFANGNWGEVTS